MAYVEYDERIRLNRIERKNKRNKRVKKVRRMRLAVVLLIAVFVIMALSTILHPAVAKVDEVKTDYPKHVVTVNDTLWDISKKYTADDKDVRETIYEICELNDLDENEDLKIGDGIVIPIN